MIRNTKRAVFLTIAQGLSALALLEQGLHRELTPEIFNAIFVIAGLAALAGVVAEWLRPLLARSINIPLWSIFSLYSLASAWTDARNQNTPLASSPSFDVFCAALAAGFAFGLWLSYRKQEKA